MAKPTKKKKLTADEKAAAKLENLLSIASNMCEPDIEGMFKSLHAAETLAEFKEVVDEMAEFTDELHNELEDLKEQTDEEDEEEEEE